MRDALETYELIDQYLNNKLSGADLTEFTNKMNSDPSLLQEVNEQRLINELIFDKGLLEIKEKLKLIDAGSQGGSIKKWVLYSGVALLVSVASITALVKEQKVDNKAVHSISDQQQTQQPVKQQNEKVISPVKKQPVTETQHGESATIVNKTQEQITKEKPEQETNKVESTPVANEVTVEKAKVIVAIDPVQSEINKSTCALEGSLLSITTVESCRENPTGKLVVDKKSSITGTAPFEFSINNKNYFKDFAFNNLYAGTYTISIRDAKGCTWHDTKEITIAEKDCRTVEYSFYPTKGDTWKFPIDANTNGKIEIYNTNGQLVYTTPIINGEPSNWDGTANGESLPMGSYVFIIRDNKKPTAGGSVTIFR
jgi:gliding motility-associated-like protein